MPTVFPIANGQEESRFHGLKSRGRLLKALGRSQLSFDENTLL